MSGLAADQFMKMPLRISHKELLKTQSHIESTEGEETGNDENTSESGNSEDTN
uniref:Uncharacterized protein n=1 Tax=Talaromyces marneffei PM1 TaxID=1077442 RepID=A0A093X7B1_TALMA